MAGGRCRVVVTDFFSGGVYLRLGVGVYSSAAGNHFVGKEVG